MIKPGSITNKMVGLTNLKRQTPVYFGHPSQFWKERQRLEMKASVDVEGMKKLTDIVDYDLVHLQKSHRLKLLLEAEEEGYIQELATRQAMEECGYCKEKENKMRSYNEGIEKEKIMECQKALEREKTAKGMMCTKADEVRLKEMQKQQMKERRLIEREEQDREQMWHQVLMDDHDRKAQFERAVEDRRQQEMIETRMCYDKQIASANRKRQEIFRIEREKENRRLDKMKKKMEQDHFDAIKKKKEQQLTNKKNFIEGHQMKLARLHDEKVRAREIDTGTIRVALENLRREEERNRMQMKSLQIEKQICVENFNRERRMASALEREVETIADEWRRLECEKTDEQMKEIDHEKNRIKQKAAEGYKKYIQDRNFELEWAKKERSDNMQRVRETAVEDLRRRLELANQELERQMEYRNSLNQQMRDNQKYLATEIINTENKDMAFTKKAVMFKDAMANRFETSTGRTSTNPLHPFRRIIESKKSLHLPIIR